MQDTSQSQFGLMQTIAGPDGGNGVGQPMQSAFQAAAQQHLLSPPDQPFEPNMLGHSEVHMGSLGTVTPYGIPIMSA